MSDKSKTTARLAALPLAAWKDDRVQQVYRLLCDEDEYPPDHAEHWEGWIARRIVAALIPGSAESV